MAKADGIPVGTIIIGLGAASTDAAWLVTAVGNALQMLSDPALWTDYLEFQSWQINPSEVSDPGSPVSQPTSRRLKARRLRYRRRHIMRLRACCRA